MSDTDHPVVRIEPETERAWCGDRLLDLTPKVFATLRHFVERRERLVTKDDLLAAVWGDTVVSEAAITSCIRDLRRALADTSRTPRYIETVHRRGFRFIGPVGPASAPSPARRAAPVNAPPSTSTLVGRDDELARLHASLATALGGERRLVFVTGEAGIGKTALVESFLGQLGDADGLRVGRGQCIEQYGATEPYLPLLEAIGRMGREPGGDTLLATLKQYAPTWLAQLPALLTDEELEAVQRRTLGATRERMLRELIDAFDAFSVTAPLVLVLEDLHWSDAATVDLLAILARRRDPARVLVLGTYRPAEVAAGTHPLRAVKQELQVHGQCDELLLDFLGEAAVGEYLSRRFPRASFSPDFARVLHENTSGSPLFLVNVVDDLVAQGHVREVDGQWALAVPVERVASGVPDTLWGMVEKQIDRLAPQEQAVLGIASVAGAEFSAALLTVDGSSAEEAERCCDGLVRRGQFLRSMGIAEWPDGTIAGRYGFIHALYRNVLYARVAIGHQVGLHLRIGARLERAHGPRAGEIAGELAMHFEEGRDFERAVQYQRQAVDTALRQHAYREAIHHASRALELLSALPRSPEHHEQELMIQTVLGAAVIATNGWADSEVARAYARARELCAEMGAVTPKLFPVLLGLQGFYLMRGELDISEEACAQLAVLAEATQDAAVQLSAHNSAGLVLFYRGKFTAALAHFEQAAKIYDPDQHSPNPLRTFSVDHDPRVSCDAHTALTLMVLGHQDRAAAQMRECLDYARSIDHPLSLAMACNFASTFHQMRREPHLVRELEDERLEQSKKHDFELFLLLGEIYRGWLVAEEGRREEGAAQIQQGLAVYQAIGAELGRPTFLGILAGVYDELDRPADALSVLAEAVEQAERTGLHYWDAELRRLKGTFLLHADPSSQTRRGSERSAAERDAESCFLEAIEIARRQESRAFELRAATSLSRLWQQQGKTKQAHAMLSQVYAWFTEGFDIPDLVDARALLDELEGTRRRR